MRLRPGPTLALALLAAFLGTCRDERPAPPPLAPPSADRLKPLTSRDDAPAPAPQPGPAQSLPPGHPPVGAPPSVSPVSGAAVSGTVAIAPRLKERQGKALFIIARSAASGQIVAVRKEQDVHFPLRFQISAADAMVEGTAFAGPFDLTVRLSKTGDAMPGAGDVEGTAKGVAAGARDVKITLDTVRQ